MKKITFILLLPLLSLWPGFLSADTTTVSGFLPGAELHEIRLMKISDRISNLEEIVDRTEIDSSGKFDFSLDIRQTLVGYLDMDYYSVTIYLEPGAKYSIVSDTLHFDNLYRSYTQKERLPCSIHADTSHSLNSLISEFNMIYNNFVNENFIQIYKRRQRYLIYDFADSVSKLFDTVDNEFFRNYMLYKIAGLELSGAPTARAKLFDKYLRNKPVLYNHPEYMFFFNQFFNRYVTSVSRYVAKKDLQYTINVSANYKALLDSLGKDTLLRNEVIRELVMLKELRDIYHSGDYYKKNIISMLQTIAGEDIFPEHRLIAANLIKLLTKLESGTPAPDIALPGLDGDTVRLAQLLDKPLYLGFFATWSYACRGELKILNDIYSRYKDKVNFVMVSLDENPEVVAKLAKEKGYDWIFLYNGDGYDILNAYGVKTFPLFVLISPEGKIMQYPAKKPSENIEAVFELLDRKRLEKNRR